MCKQCGLVDPRLGTIIQAPQDDVVWYSSPTCMLSFQMLHQARDTNWHSNTLQHHLNPPQSQPLPQSGVTALHIQAGTT